MLKIWSFSLAFTLSTCVSNKYCKYFLNHIYVVQRNVFSATEHEPNEYAWRHLYVTNTLHCFNAAKHLIYHEMG